MLGKNIDFERIRNRNDFFKNHSDFVVSEKSIFLPNGFSIQKIIKESTKLIRFRYITGSGRNRTTNNNILF